MNIKKSSRIIHAGSRSSIESYELSKDLDISYFPEDKNVLFMISNIDISFYHLTIFIKMMGKIYIAIIIKSRFACELRDH